MTNQPAFPGFGATYSRLEVTRTGPQLYTLRVTATDDPRYVSSADTVVYEDLVEDELFDVVAAILDGCTTP